jgi:hypothetical protein
VKGLASAVDRAGAAGVAGAYPEGCARLVSAGWAARAAGGLLLAGAVGTIERRATMDGGAGMPEEERRRATEQLASTGLTAARDGLPRVGALQEAAERVPQLPRVTAPALAAVLEAARKLQAEILLVRGQLDRIELHLGVGEDEEESR